MKADLHFLFARKNHYQSSINICVGNYTEANLVCIGDKLMVWPVDMVVEIWDKWLVQHNLSTQDLTDIFVEKFENDIAR